MVDIFKNLSAFQQGFGGYAAPVETNSAKIFFFDNGRFQSKL
jgi:hypothetical protein